MDLPLSFKPKCLEPFYLVTLGYVVEIQKYSLCVNGFHFSPIIALVFLNEPVYTPTPTFLCRGETSDGLSDRGDF